MKHTVATFVSKIENGERSPQNGAIKILHEESNRTERILGGLNTYIPEWWVSIWWAAYKHPSLRARESAKAFIFNTYPRSYIRQCIRDTQCHQDIGTQARIHFISALLNWVELSRKLRHVWPVQIAEVVKKRIGRLRWSERTNSVSNNAGKVPSGKNGEQLSQRNNVQFQQLAWTGDQSINTNNRMRV